MKKKMIIQEQRLGTTNKRKRQQKSKNKIRLKYKKDDEDLGARFD
jgi:hypothetical protein